MPIEPSSHAIAVYDAGRRIADPGPNGYRVGMKVDIAIAAASENAVLENDLVASTR